MNIRPKNRLFCLIAAIGVLLDYLTKQWTIETFPVGEGITVIPGVLNFTHVKNPGAAWGLLSGHPELLLFLSIVASVALAVYGWAMRLTRWEQAGCGFLFSGAFGNGIERLLAGEVVDFIQAFPVTRFPVFNLADIWINIGIICFFIAAISEVREERRQSKGK